MGFAHLCFRSLCAWTILLACTCPFTARAQDITQWVHNANPNYTAIHEYGRIEWHGKTATLIAGGSRPLDTAAYTLSTCLDLSVSAEDPHYEFKGDLMDITAPQWSAKHPDSHVYAGRPGKVDVSFPVDANGLPSNLPALLNDAASQINQILPWGYKVVTRPVAGKTFYSFVPTQNRNASGQVQPRLPYMDTRINISPQVARISYFADVMAEQMTVASGNRFHCCEMGMTGRGWGSRVIRYQAVNRRARDVLEDLLVENGLHESYTFRCQPLDKRFCFINVYRTFDRPRVVGGECAALGRSSR